MNSSSTDDPADGGIFTSGRISGFGYGIGIAVSFLIVVTTITLVSYCCARGDNTASDGEPPRRRRPGEPADDGDDTEGSDVEAGIAEATLKSYPKMAYSRAKLRGGSTTASCCSICLADYRDADVLRLLPDCGHVFHLRCVDPWLRSHPSCPVCRSSPMPTPLADVVPLVGSSQS